MTDNAFPRASRILNTADYDKVFKNPVRASAPGVLILAIKNENSGMPRLGLVVPKKILKRAVWRNRVKRIARETFRLYRHSLPNVDLVFIARPSIGDISNRALSALLRKLWDQISRRLAKQASD